MTKVKEEEKRVALLQHPSRPRPRHLRMKLLSWDETSAAGPPTAGARAPASLEGCSSRALSGRSSRGLRGSFDDRSPHGSSGRHESILRCGTTRYGSCSSTGPAAADQRQSVFLAATAPRAPSAMRASLREDRPVHRCWLSRSKISFRPTSGCVFLAGVARPEELPATIIVVVGHIGDPLFTLHDLAVGEDGNVRRVQEFPAHPRLIARSIAAHERRPATAEPSRRPQPCA